MQHINSNQLDLEYPCLIRLFFIHSLYADIRLCTYYRLVSDLTE